MFAHSALVVDYFAVGADVIKGSVRTSQSVFATRFIAACDGFNWAGASFDSARGRAKSGTGRRIFTTSSRNSGLNP